MAMTKRHPDIGYLTGLITPNDVVVIVAASEDAENEQEVAHAFLAYCKEKTWKIFEEEIDIVSVAVGQDKFSRHVIAMGAQGDVIINHPTGVLRERVHKGKGGPGHLRNVHEVRVVGNHYVAVGMRRQVYRRPLGNGAWSRFDAGVLLADGSKDVAGFTSVDGFSDDEIYAVGHGGEIWLAENGKWQQIDSPTDAFLQCVRCGRDGDVVICGADGMVLRGRRSQWTSIDAGGVSATLKSAAQFNGQWFLADEEGGLHVITENGLKPEPPFEKLDVTAGVLDSNERVLLSVGEEDLMLFDGKKWRRLPHPPIDLGA